jgi:hypothetical protein
MLKARKNLNFPFYKNLGGKMSRKRLTLLGFGALFIILGIAINAFIQVLEEIFLPPMRQILPTFSFTFTKSALTGISVGFIVIGIYFLLLSIINKFQKNTAETSKNNKSL